MAAYLYTTKDGETVERHYPMGKAPRTVTVDGKRAYRDLGAEHGGHRNTPGAWPMWSDAAGHHPSQNAEVQAYLRSRGLHADVDATGRIKFESRGHRKAVCEAFGLYDRSGGYGDPQKRH